MKWRDGWITAAAIFGLWAVYALSIAVQGSLHLLFPTVPTDQWDATLKMHLSSRWVWALFTPGIVFLTRKFPIARDHWKQPLLIHGATFVVLSTAVAGLAKLLAPVLGTPPQSWSLAVIWLMQLYYNFVAYAAVAAIGHALEFYRRFGERQRRAAQLELESAKLESQITRAQLESLKARLQPHFLFNALHAISELIHENPDAAERMVTRLGDLLRMAVDDGDRQEVSLRQELAFLDAYLDIERVRHGERLVFRAAVDDDALDARVPHLLLQPIVENAIRYGVSARRDGCVIGLAAARRNGSLEIQIDDNGPGLPSAPNALREGVGLGNTRARLQALYGDAHRLELVNRVGGGTTVRIAVPWRREAGEIIGQNRVA